jgi:hypothetical protein
MQYCLIPDFLVRFRKIKKRTAVRFFIGVVSLFSLYAGFLDHLRVLGLPQAPCEKHQFRMCDGGRSAAPLALTGDPVRTATVLDVTSSDVVNRFAASLSVQVPR